MSTNSELKALLERLGPVRVAGPRPSSFDRTIPISMRRAGVLDQPVSIARRLREAGATMRAAHAALTRLASDGVAVCEVDHEADLGLLANDLLAMNVNLRRRREIAEPAAYLADVRTRHRLSQREFAEMLGLDVRTLQNWEQGRNRPDPAALSLIYLFDQSPEMVVEAAFEPVP